ncbi:MAG: ImmA/IrrE family metallo-endopeptidase [Chloroflexota bacterium]|nr:ImmA/IrrE family metallo-endopeptidase [Chloroflexota bacterium]
MPLATQAISGISHSSPEWGECILVNTGMHQHRRVFDLLHEYGHLLVDGIAGWRVFGEAEIHDDLIERRADAFATAFLLPEEGVVSYLETRGVRPGEATYLDVFFVMNAFGSSYQATLYRLEELGYLTRHHVRSYLTARNITEMAARVRRAEGIRQVDLEHPTGRRFGQLVMRALARDKLSLGRVGELLDLDPLEVRELALLWAATEESDLPLLAG